MLNSEDRKRIVALIYFAANDLADDPLTALLLLEKYYPECSTLTQTRHY